MPKKVVNRRINRAKLAEELIGRVMAGVDKGLSPDDAVRATLKSVGIRFNEQLAQALSAIYKQAVKDVSKSVGISLAFTPLDKAMIHRIMYSPAFDTVMHNYDMFAKQQIRKVLEDVTTVEPETIQQIKNEMVYRLGVVEHRGYNIARTEMANIYNIALEEQYKRIDPTGEGFLYKWFGPEDMRTTDICSHLAKMTANGVTLSDLKKLIKEEAQTGRFAIPGFIYDDSRPWVPHFQCRHTFIAERRSSEVLKELEKERVYLKPGEQAPQGKQVFDGPRGGHYYISDDGGDVGEDPSIPSWVNEYQENMGGKIQMRVQTADGSMWVVFDIESVDLIDRKVRLRDQAGNEQSWPLSNFRPDNIYYIPPVGPPVDEEPPDLPARKSWPEMTIYEKWQQWPGGMVVTPTGAKYLVLNFRNYGRGSNWIDVQIGKRRGYIPESRIVDYIPPSSVTKPPKKKKIREPMMWPDSDVLTPEEHAHIVQYAPGELKWAIDEVAKRRPAEQKQMAVKNLQRCMDNIHKYAREGKLTKDEQVRIWVTAVFGNIEGAGVWDDGRVYIDMPDGYRERFRLVNKRIGTSLDSDWLAHYLGIQSAEMDFSLNRMFIRPEDCSLETLRSLTRIVMEGGEDIDGPKFVAHKAFMEKFRNLHPKIRDGAMKVIESCGEDFQMIDAPKIAIQYSSMLGKNTLGQAFDNSDVISFSGKNFIEPFARYSNEEIKDAYQQIMKIAQKPYEEQSPEIQQQIDASIHITTSDYWNKMSVAMRLKNGFIRSMLDSDIKIRNTYQLTLAHELGHHIFFKMIKNGGGPYERFKELVRDGWANVTNYAVDRPKVRGEPHEPFAECYMLYKNVPEYLKVASPFVYDFFKNNGFKEGY